ncbi:MAG TPA: CBS domain-containing protein [Acidimicrobiales bacterium]|nr:CBS domain-containing protein [Acidimicrobiales bacterium]
MAIEILHLSAIVKSALVDSDADRLGRVDDLIVRLGDTPHPPLSGLVVRIGRRALFVPIERIAEIGPGRVEMVGDTVNLQRFDRRPGELLLVKDLLARHLINLQGARLIRANEIEIARFDGRWEIVGVDPSPRVALRRLLPRMLARHIPTRTGTVVDWASIEPFVAHVPTARLRIPYRKLARLHPAQIADLVEAASHDEGEEIIEAVGQDRELEADVFEELDSEHQLEFIRSRSDSEAARLLATMAPDDAADLLTDLDQERRLPVLQNLPAPQQRKIRALLSYNSETAGGLMSPDFLVAAETTAVSDVLAAIRTSQAPPEALAVVFSCDDVGQVTGTASVVTLVRAQPSATLGSVVRPDPPHVHADWDIHAIVRKMSDFNLTVAPVMDEQHLMIGVITVDDVLEQLLPTGWRRDYGMAAAEE